MNTATDHKPVRKARTIKEIKGDRIATIPVGTELEVFYNAVSRAPGNLGYVHAYTAGFGITEIWLHEIEILPNVLPILDDADIKISVALGWSYRLSPHDDSYVQVLDADGKIVGSTECYPDRVARLWKSSLPKYHESRDAAIGAILKVVGDCDASREKFVEFLETDTLGIWKWTGTPRQKYFLLTAPAPQLAYALLLFIDYKATLVPTAV